MTKHEEVYRDLRQKILDGHYASWGSLENEAVLCKRYEVSKPTLQKAITRLKQDGFLHTRQGSGIFVNPPEFFRQNNNLTTLSERFAGTGQRVESRVLELERVECGDLDDVFHLGPKEELIHYRRLRLVDGEPHAVEDTHMPAYLFKDFDERALDGSMIHYIEDVCGYGISHDVKRVHAILPSERDALLLGRDAGSPLLQIDHFVYLVKSVIVQYTEEITVDEDIKIPFVR